MSYGNMQNNSPEILRIIIKDVKIPDVNSIRKTVITPAVEVSVLETKSSLKVNDTIKISYDYQETYPKGWVGSIYIFD